MKRLNIELPAHKSLKSRAAELHWITLLLALLLCLPCAAQSPQEMESRMDEIKLNENFIYGESYSEDKDMAYQNALVELATSINELRADRDSIKITTSDLQPVIKEMRSDDGRKHHSFLYLPLSQALSLTPKDGHDNIAANVTPSGSNSPAPQPQHQEERPQMTFVPATPAQTPASSQVSAQASAAVMTQAQKELIDIIRIQGNWVEIRGWLKSYKDEGKIRETGRCVSYAEVPDDAYSILMDEMAGILAILSPKNASNRINHKTGQPDNPNNHPNCKFIVWYR